MDNKKREKQRLKARLSYEEEYGQMLSARIPIEGKLHNTLVEVCQQNAWLKVRGIPFADDIFFEMDSPYSFCRIDDIAHLETFFEHGNWAIRNGVVHKNLFFCNQVNGGDEWWACRLDDASGKWVPFDSISFRFFVADGSFKTYIEALVSGQLGPAVSCA